MLLRDSSAAAEDVKEGERERERESRSQPQA
jgi:hypothetical protein